MAAGNSCTRRRFLARGGATAVGVALAGCGDDRAASPATTAESPTDPPDTDAGPPDLREANVVGVSVERRDGGHRFSVTLHHDDDGEPGYANRWQVERRDGTRLGRRELLHAHSQQPFTRSETIELPADVDCVVVRGHDQTHGYGGQAMLVDPATGTTRAVRQGAEPIDVSGEDCA